MTTKQANEMLDEVERRLGEEFCRLTACDSAHTFAKSKTRFNGSILSSPPSVNG